MITTETEPLVLKLLASCAGVDLTIPSVETTTLDDLGLDSLARLEVITRLQNELGQQLNDDVVQGPDTPRSIATNIAAIIGTSAAPGSSADSSHDRPEENGPAATDVTIFIAAPLELTWDLTNDLPSWPNLFSEYASLEILQVDGPTTTFRLTTRPDDAGQQWSWVSERTTDRQRYRVDAQRIELGWFDYMHLIWGYEEVDGGTLMRWRQWFHMRSDSPVDQDRMVANITRGSHIQQNRIKNIIETANTPVARTPAP